MKVVPMDTTENSEKLHQVMGTCTLNLETTGTGISTTKNYTTAVGWELIHPQSTMAPVVQVYIVLITPKDTLIIEEANWIENRFRMGTAPTLLESSNINQTILYLHNIFTQMRVNILKAGIPAMKTFLQQTVLARKTQAISRILITMIADTIKRTAVKVMVWTINVAADDPLIPTAPHRTIVMTVTTTAGLFPGATAQEVAARQTLPQQHFYPG